MNEAKDKLEIVIVGGGLVGTLNALFFAQYDRFNVTICEKSADCREVHQTVGRSINLSLSQRGLMALKIVDLQEEVLKNAIPMYARMIHERSGSLKRFFYGKSSQCIYAIERRVLLNIILSKAGVHKNIQIKFNTKLVDLDLVEKIAKFNNLRTMEDVEMKFDLLIGNDGAHSLVRHFMTRNSRMDFSQEYISHGYIELAFPAINGNEHPMNKNYLHVWPRDEYMLIALPNLDGSFSGTLFMPFSVFESIYSKNDLLNLFEKDFPDALEIIGKSNLCDLFQLNKPSKMVTIRCNPYNLDDKCLIMGDAAHAMVPFYGQGMNCGFEDVTIFHEILQKNAFNLGKTCVDFSENRIRDANAMCDLSLYNYLELRKNVTMISFRLRKMFDNIMNCLFPSYWIPLYAMVCFTHIPYRKCVEEKQKQDKILAKIQNFVIGIIVVGIIIGANRFLQNKN